MTHEMFPGVALITGAGSGIGQAVSCSFAKEGCKRISIADRNEKGLQDTERIIKSEFPDVDVLQYTLDVSQEDDVAGLLKATIDRFGRVDYACNAAGVLGPDKRSHELSSKEFDQIVGIDYRGCWLTSREELKYMVNQEPLPTHDGRQGNRGSIVNIASQLGIVSRPTAPAYCSAKAAVIGLTKSDAIDYSKDNIRINCVCPGVIETPMVTEVMEYMKPAIDIAPLKRPGTAQEVADCVLFLCSSKATFVQGSALVVDGGYVIN
ncbi:hypothetical protein M8818_003776 [Zalaria obscura]|uniref:Uncharacterized protein n=1 Tax=Zalaria obscura TaxID=2024903 RepID=A0ACC3SDE1_9PEZI